MEKKTRKKFYRYTLLKTDGTEEVLSVQPKEATLEQLQEWVGGWIELIPPDYYRHNKWGHCDVFGHEEARFNSESKVNTHFKELAPGFNVLGDCVRKDKVFPD